MTIVVNVTVPEGIIFAADSRQTFTNRNGDVRVNSDHAYKLFQITPRVAAVTYGWAFLDGRNINSHVNDFRVTLENPDQPVEEISKLLGEYLSQKYKTHIEKKIDNPVEEGNYALGLLVGGFDPGNKVGKVFEIYIPNGEIYLRRSTDEMPGASWRGHTPVISRLLRGFDTRINKVNGYTEDLGKEIDENNTLGYNVDYWVMTLQDAADYALFLVHTTIQMQRFSDGITIDPGSSANCGGPIDLAVIDPLKGFQWIQRKQLHGETGSLYPSTAET